MTKLGRPPSTNRRPIRPNKPSTQISVAKEVDAQISGQVIGQVSGHVTEQISAQVNRHISRQVSGQVTEQSSGQIIRQICGQVAGRVIGQVGAQVTDQMNGQISAQVNRQVSGEVTGQVSRQDSGQFNGNVVGQISGQITNEITAQIPSLQGDQAHEKASKVAVVPSVSQLGGVIEIINGYTAVTEDGQNEQMCLVQLPVSSGNYQTPILVPTAAFQPGMQLVHAGSNTAKRPLENGHGNGSLNEPTVKRLQVDESVKQPPKKKPSPIRSLLLSPEFSDAPKMSPNSLGLEFPSFPSPFPTPGVLPPTPTQTKSELNTPTFQDVSSNNFQFPVIDTPITPSLKVSHINSPVMVLSGGSLLQAAVPNSTGLRLQNGISPLVTSNTAGFQITPTTTKPRTNSIQPSTKKIVNLMPVFSEGKSEPQQPNPTGLKIIARKPPQTGALIVPANAANGKPLTPVSNGIDTGVLTAHDNNRTPSQNAIPVRPMATPSTFFRNTPGSEAAQTAVFMQNPNSAFQQVDSTTNVNVQTARRLPLY